MGRRMLTIVSGDLYSITHANSLDLNTAEDIVNFTNNTFGFADEWTVSFWWKSPATTYTGATTLFHMRPSATVQSRIEITIQGGVANDPVRIILTDSALNNIKQYDYNNAAATLAWQLYTFTWSGATDTLTFYKDGSALVPDALTTDTTGTMDDAARRIAFGCNISGVTNTAGNYHSLAIWSSALSAADVLKLYHNGNGYNYNVRNANDADLVLWTLTGYAVGDLFHNEVGSVNIGLNQTGITDADIIADYPGL